MGIKHVKGDFFDAEHSADHKAFGFSGSLQKPAMARGGAMKGHSDAKQDRALIKTMINQAEAKEAPGLAMGGQAKLPRGMKAKSMISRSPIMTPPRNPQVTRTPSNSMPGGVMPYGMQPSTEKGYAPSNPDGSDIGSSPGPGMGMKRGGKMKGWK